MKRIGILAFTETHGDGVYHYTQSLIDALSIDGDNQYVILTNISERRFDGNKLEVRKVGKRKIPWIAKVYNYFMVFCNFRHSLFISGKELEAFQDIDLLISPDQSPYPHYYLKKPFIFTLHDMQERYYPNYFTFPQRISRFALNKALASTSSAIICESSFVKKDIVEFVKANEKKIFVIPSPPPDEFLNFVIDENKTEAIKRKYDLPSKYIYYPAQSWIHKNHIRLIEAYDLIRRQFDDVYLILTGSQQHNYKNIIAKINELKLNDRVKHLGYVDYGDMPYLYKMSQMLVMPTLFESVSMPIYEAFALGIPVCSSNVVALPEQVGDAGLIFNPLDPNDMANKIISILSDDKLKQTLSDRGKKRVSGFDHANYARQLRSVIASVR